MNPTTQIGPIGRWLNSLSRNKWQLLLWAIAGPIWIASAFLIIGPTIDAIKPETPLAMALVNGGVSIGCMAVALTGTACVLFKLEFGSWWP